MGSNSVYFLVARSDLGHSLSARCLWRPVFLEKVDASEFHGQFEGDCLQISFTSV